MIPETLGLFWLYILGALLIAVTILFYGEARLKAKKLGLKEVYDRLGIEDLEKC